MLNEKLLFYFNLCLFVCLSSMVMVTLIWAGTEFKHSYDLNFVAAVPNLGLPRYYGSCAGLVALTYNALEQNQYLEEHLSEDNNKNKSNYRLKIISVIANAFTYSSTCQDSEAIGLMLNSDANITLDAAFNKIIPFNEAVPLARSYYNEANQLGYYNNHKVQAFLLRERISRNAFRVTIKAPF